MIPQSPTTYCVVSRTWTIFSDPDCKRSRPRNDNKFPRNSSGGLELVFVSKTRVSEQPPSKSSSYPNQEGTMEMREEVLSSVRAQDMLQRYCFLGQTKLYQLCVLWQIP